MTVTMSVTTTVVTSSEILLVEVVLIITGNPLVAAALVAAALLVAAPLEAPVMGNWMVPVQTKERLRFLADTGFGRRRSATKAVGNEVHILSCGRAQV